MSEGLHDCIVDVATSKVINNWCCSINEVKQRDLRVFKSIKTWKNDPEKYGKEKSSIIDETRRSLVIKHSTDSDGALNETEG